MKKLFFAAIAALFMSISFTSCGGSSSPTDKMLGCMEEMVSVMKGTSIKSASDVEALKSKMEGIQKDVEEISKASADKMKDMSEEDVAKYLEKVGKLQEEMQAEMERLEGEAAAAGIDMDDF